MKHTHFTTFRKALALTTVLLLLLSLAGCWKKDEPDSPDDPSGQVPPASTNGTSAPPETTTGTIPEPPATEEPTPPPTEAPDVPSQPPAKEPEPETDKRMGTVLPEKLNIRKEARIDAAKAGYYVKDDRIELLEIKDGWGRTKHGWVWLEYVKLDNANTKPEDPSTEELISDGKTKALGYGVVTLGTLNVRTGPSSKHDKLGTVSYGERYAYYQKDANWVRIEKGWISLSYFYVEGTTGEGAGTGTIKGSYVNIRSGPSTDFDKVGTYKEGDKIDILVQVNKWGYTDKGWVSMDYVEMKVPSTGKGTVTADSLNIRKEAKIESEKVGSYEKGTKIEILEVKGNWGRTDKGWVSLDYVDMDENNTTNTTKKTGTVTANGLNIRKNADINSESVGGYKKGDKVEILETKDGWGRTDKGWIWLEYVKMDK